MLTHFSSRYPGDAAPGSIRQMRELTALAESQYERGRVTAAADLMKVRIAIDGELAISPHQQRQPNRGAPRRHGGHRPSDRQW